MDFSISEEDVRQRTDFKAFLQKNLAPYLSVWFRKGVIPRPFFEAMGGNGWFGFEAEKNVLRRRSHQQAVMVMEEIARISPGVALAVMVHTDLGLGALDFFGSDRLKEAYGPPGVRGDLLFCLGNSENTAGTDVAGVAMNAEKVKGGWRLTGSKAYVSNALVSDFALVTAVSDPEAERNRRLSMFLVDLSGDGVKRTKLKKHVLLPSDLTRIALNRVFVPDDHLLGECGRGLQQVLSLFNHSRVHFSALTLGTAQGALELALDHGEKRKVFGERIWNFQAKAFEAADCRARIEAVRLLLLKACWAMEHQDDFRLESSVAKYMAVETARRVTQWAADIFGASSVIFDHPIHKFPMDAWAESIGEGTQDVQKLVIFREMMKQRQAGRPGARKG